MDPFTEYIHPDAPWDDALAQLLGDSNAGWPGDAEPGTLFADPPPLEGFPGGTFTGWDAANAFFGGYEGVFDGTSPSAKSAGTTATMTTTTTTSTSSYATETTYTASPSAAARDHDLRVVGNGEGSTEGGDGDGDGDGEADVGWGAVVVGQEWGVAPGLLGIPDPATALMMNKMPSPSSSSLSFTHVPVVPSMGHATPLPLPLPLPPPSAASETAHAPAAKLHNKVEKRYRYNVKNALETLRDSVPRLRQVYGTSLPLELATTDREDARGLMGGLEPLGKPTKKTVMLGARLYIEHLETEQRVQACRLARAQQALRGRMCDEEMSVWASETEQEVMRVREEYARLLEEKAKMRAAAHAGPGDEADRDEEDEQEVGPPPPPPPPSKKRARAAADHQPVEKKPRRTTTTATTTTRKARTSVASTSSSGTAATAATAAATTTAFYSFGLAYVLFPRATEWLGFRPRDASTAANGTGVSGGKVLLSMDNGASSVSGRVSSTVLDMIGYLVLGLVIMAGVYLFSRRQEELEEEEEEEDEDHDESASTDSAERSGIQRLARSVGLGTVGGLANEILYRIPFLHQEPMRPSTQAAWYKLYSAHVGRGVKYGRLESLHLSLHLGRHADDGAASAMLHALQANDLARPDAWIKARKICNVQDSSRSLQDVCVLALHEAEQWLNKITPTLKPLEDIANQLVLEELDHVLTHLYVTLVAATYPHDSAGTQLAVLVDNMQSATKTTHAMLADAAFKARIQRVLAAVEKDSESHVLGLVVIGLWGHLVGQEASRQRALANMLIAQQIQRPDGLMTDLQSVDMLLALILPGYKNPKSIKKRTTRRPRLSATAQELDNVASVCLRYLLLLRSVPQLAKPDAPRQQRQRSSMYVRQACLEIRMLLARPAFDTRPVTDLGVLFAADDGRAAGPAESSDRGDDDDDDDEEEAEDADFARQTERLIDLMTIVGCRAASRAGGRDDDSGVEGDLEEL
ncbi:hypothetical protein NliqN6_0392 [Naganishia liquefaciens]|uniref:BHLH domain-containing protein n=1 Tax=Naganishia liquefaciens TaxID=104408 RepID=A0A8H3TMU7_9TREE|nr:hypothetical protein NliqN6_0392 [Naganishia liquefaciens]